MHILFVVQDLNFEHLGVMVLSSVLKKAGHNVDIVEARYETIKKKLENNNFAILAYSAHTFIIRYYLNLNLKIKKEFKILSVFGGPHIALYPETINEPGVDGICIGEGEYALPDLVNNLSAGKPITNIQNWWIKQDGKIFKNPCRPVIKDLDSLPFADRRLFASPDMAIVSTTRGCQYQCAFCAQQGAFRRRSVDNVIQELRQIVKITGMRYIYFADSSLNFSAPWLKEFSQAYKREIRLPFYCYVRADLITEESASYLKEAGCFSVIMGVETANDYLRNDILKKGLSRDKIVDAAKLIKRHKIRLRTTSIIGIPHGSLRDDLDTIRLNIQCRPDYALAFLLVIFKNTQSYDLLMKEEGASRNIRFVNDYLLWESYGGKKIKNLRRLFSLAVEFPFILPLLPFLIGLPLDIFYAFLHVVWMIWCFCFRFSKGTALGLRMFFFGIKYKAFLKE
ncbi:MAG: radical SAM protein [Candidatus Omnitrophota bacterium]|nr:radical SAM protein [Candidatus Omnitrophota bacterium]